MSELRRALRDPSGPGAPFFGSVERDRSNPARGVESVQEALRQRSRTAAHEILGASRPSRLFEYLLWRGCSPQIWAQSPFHSLGIEKLSILLPQAGQPILHQASSEAWGFVVNIHPQPVDKIFVHRGPSSLSTGDPQAGPACPQLPQASPHLCPLFGNATPAFTAPSERRHTKRVGWAVGKLGKAGDRPGEKPPCPVYRLCRTFGCPQKPRVFHRVHPQGRWTKNRP